MNLKIVGLNFAYNNGSSLNSIHLEVQAGEIFALLGPNGAGKTTLLKIISGVLRPNLGSVYLDLKNLANFQPMEIARCLAFVEQDIPVGFDFNVQQIVELGRISHKKRWQRMDGKDHEIIQGAMKKTDVAQFYERPLCSLSSGERQRVWLAMALAQEPSILLLDEPTSHLDIRYQIEILDLIQNLSKQNLAVILSLHDLNLAARYAHRIALMKNGQIQAMGKPKEILTEATIYAVYQVHTEIVVTPQKNLLIGFVR